MQKLKDEFFSRLGETLSSTLSAFISRRVVFESPRVLPLERAELFKRITTRGAIFAAPVAAPFHSLLVQFFPEDMGKLLPELGINPDARAAPPTFTDLHKSALQEMFGNAWAATAPALTDALGLPFKIGKSGVSWNSFPDFIENLPAVEGINDFTAALFRLTIDEAPSSISAVVMPSDFFEKVHRKVHKPPPPSPVKKQARMEALQVERVEKTDVQPLATGRGKAAKTARPKNLETILDIPVLLVVELGDGRMEVEQILDLAQGSVIELSQKVDEPLELKVEGVAVARGEVVAVDDNFGIRVAHIITPEERLKE